MKYLSVCSGIEAASVAWEPLGWTPSAFSEIEAFPRAVLKHHYSATPLHDDFTTIGANDYGSIDLLVGGTPCQGYSIAGLRGGLDDARSVLTLEFSKLSYRKRTRWFLWENVPGVFSTNGGFDFGAILATFSGHHGRIFQPPRTGWRNSGIVEPANAESFGIAWRVLDAQYFGVPQRRRRVFVVGYLGDWRRAAAVLFERQCLSRHSAPRREKGETAPTIPSRNTAGGGLGTDFDCDVSNAICAHNGQRNEVSDMINGLVAAPERVRRLTVRECERLQGFPDDYTLVSYRGKPAADGPRYKSLGNSMAVPVMRWIGQRIGVVDAMGAIEEAA
jgi:DNA (cytosine-5)-methyltransferase 1